MADWSEIPLDILVLIVERLHSMEDFACFGATCKWWQYAASLLEKPLFPITYPSLMLAETTESETRSFRSLLTSKTYELKLPEAMGRKCLGAGYGWLMTIGMSDLLIHLLHPYSRQQICLPPMLTFPEQYGYCEDFQPQEVIDMFVQKVAMSSDPRKEEKDCVVATIYGECGFLAFARLGDSVWTRIRAPSQCYDDIVYYKGKFYAVDCHGSVVVCHLDDNNGPKATVVAKYDTLDWIQKYLVESCGHLLLVSRTRKGTVFDVNKDDNDGDKKETRAYYTSGFSLLRLKECDQEEEEDEEDNHAYGLIQVTSLRDQALFIGLNSSTSIAFSGCIKANCIYFSDDNYVLYIPHPGGGGHDTGIFNMEDGAIQLNYAGESSSNFSPPLWYI